MAESGDRLHRHRTRTPQPLAASAWIMHTSAQEVQTASTSPAKFAGLSAAGQRIVATFGHHATSGEAAEPSGGGDRLTRQENNEGRATQGPQARPQRLDGPAVASREGLKKLPDKPYLQPNPAPPALNRLCGAWGPAHCVLSVMWPPPILDQHVPKYTSFMIGAAQMPLHPHRPGSTPHR